MNRKKRKIFDREYARLLNEGLADSAARRYAYEAANRKKGSGVFVVTPDNIVGVIDQVKKSPAFQVMRTQPSSIGMTKCCVCGVGMATQAAAMCIDPDGRPRFFCEKDAPSLFD